MSAAMWFDPDEELQKLRSTPAKVANPAKVESLGGDEHQLKPPVKAQKSEDPPAKPAKVAKATTEDAANFSGFSNFSRGARPKSQNPPHCSPEVSSPDKNTLATLAGLAGGQVQNRIFHNDARETGPTDQGPTPSATIEPVIFWTDSRMIDPANPPAPYAREFDQSQEANAWLCPHCGREAEIDDVFPSQDNERILTMWRCGPCQVVAVTPDTIKQPPSQYIKRTQQ